MKKNGIIILCLGLSLLFSLVITCAAADVEIERKYNPLDLVVVVDKSGSMRSSDPNRTALDAVRMLVNMAPAKDARIGIVGFNTEASILTKDASGNGALIPLDEFTGVETIRSDVSEIVYNGGTGIGNALKAAADLLKSRAIADHTKAIILFTDGVNDFGYNKLALAACEENEVDALKWAKENNCKIYCVGYDYTTSSGASSMGVGGEGIQKLQNIAGSTGGTCQVIHDISGMEQLLIDFLADVSDLIYVKITTIPGDGGAHECPIHVSPNVVEANIRIAGGGTNAIKNGKIQLFDPSGKEVPLSNSGNVRFDTDATAASIKVMMPKTGDWVLKVEGISGDDIHVGLLEHFKMNLTSRLIFPEGNPEGVAYTNDVVGIKTWLSYDGVPLENEAIYEAVTSAIAVCVSRADPDDKQVLTLTRDGQSFVGSFVIPEDCYYDVNIRLEWDTVYREDTLPIKSDNSPVKLVKDIEDVKVNKGKTLTLDDIFQYVHDEENDPITVSLKSVSATGVVDIDFIGDKVDITGVKGWWAKTLVTLAFSDPQGTTVTTSFKVSVGDPWAVVILVSIFVLLVLLVLGLVIFLYRKTFRITGKVRVVKLAEAVDSGGLEPTVQNLLFESSFKYDIGGKPAQSRRPGVTPPHGPNGGFTSTGAGFPIGNGGFNSTAGGFGEQKTGFGIGNGGFSNQGNPTGTANGNFGTVAGAFGTKAEEFVEPGDESKFNGEMELGLILGNERNLFKVLQAFAEKYEKHMTANGTGESRKAKVVKSFISQLSVLRDAKILGTSMGLKGIQIKLPKKASIKSHSLRIERFKIKTNVNSGKYVTLKLSLPRGEENGKKTCYYFEIEYKN